MVGAEAWLRALLERGLEPNHVTYSTVISACSRGGDVRGASKWLEKMLNDPNVKPNVVSFNSAIQAAAKAGGSKSGRISPLEGLAFLISAINP